MYVRSVFLFFLLGGGKRRKYDQSQGHDGKRKIEPVPDLWVAVVGKYVIWWEGKIGK